MTSAEMEDAEDSSGVEDAAPAAPESKAPAPESKMSVDSDPIAFDANDSGSKKSFLHLLNPLRLFRARGVAGFIADGKDLLGNGSLAQATVAFNRALEVDPDNTAAFRGLGKVYFKKGGRANMEIALTYYQEATLRSPTDHDLYAITSKIYDGLGKRKEATLERKKMVIVRALEADEGNPVANNNMGILYLQQGKSKLALEHFQRALRSDRNFDVAHRNIAATHYQLARKAEDPAKKAELISKAKEEIQNALGIQESMPSLLALARILLMDRQYEDVMELCTKMDLMSPANKDVTYIKKLALESLGRFDEAKDVSASYEVFKHENEPTAEE